MGSITRAVLAMLAIGPAVAGAEGGSTYSEDLRIQGFLSQGFLNGSANRFFGPSDQGSWDFRELGVNASYQPRPEILLAGQALSRRAGELYDDGVRLDYALVDLAPVMQPDLRAGLRLGRLKNPLGLYNDTRDMPFTRPSIFLPQSIYFDKVRNLELSVDGAGVYADCQCDWGDLYFQFQGGRLDPDENVEAAFLFGDLPGRLVADSPWFVGRVGFEPNGGRLRLAFSGARGFMEYEPTLGDAVSPGTVDVTYWIVSAQYVEENWTLTAEYSREPVDWKGFGPAFPIQDATGEGYYLQVQYVPAPDWELLLRYDVHYVDRGDRDGSALEAASGVPGHNFYAKDLTLGVRWDLTPQVMLRAEYHRVAGTSWLSARENDLAATEKDWDLFALQASYRF